MTKTGIPFQSDFNQRDQFLDGLCRAFLMACIKGLAISILIQIPSAAASSEWIIMPWRTFHVKKELVMQPRQGKVVKQRKTETGKHPKVDDAGAYRLRESQREWSDVSSFYVSGLSARIWGSYLRHAGVSPVLLKSGMQAEKLFWPDLLRNTMPQENSLINPSDKRSSVNIKEERTAHYIRLSFFNHDMKDLNRDVPERHANRYSPLETLLFPSSGASNQPVLETMGKIFEPKIDLGIEF